MKILKFTILGKPPAKSSKVRFGRRGMFFHPEIYRYENYFASQVKPECRFKFKEEDRLKVIIDWYPDSRRQDIDSPAKIIFDCMQRTGIIHNDNRIDDYHIKRYQDKINPRVDVFIQVLRKRNDKSKGGYNDKVAK